MKNRVIWKSMARRRAKLIKKMQRTSARDVITQQQLAQEVREIERAMVARWNDKARKR